jgi:hypothetical protein
VSRAAHSSALPDDVIVQLVNQVPVLLGVIVGALASYLTTAATERARWKRALDSRWDDRRVEAYASYAQSVRRLINIAGRIAAGRGLGGDGEPLSPIQENLDLLAAAEAERGWQWETVLLLGHPQTVAAARNWHEHAWRLEWYARARLTGNNADWQAARTATDVARHKFYEAARSDLRVGGGSLFRSEDSHATRVQRIRGDPPPQARLLPILSMRTVGGEVARGRWAAQVSDGRLSKPLAVDGVAVFVCCTTFGLSVVGLSGRISRCPPGAPTRSTLPQRPDR